MSKENDQLEEGIKEGDSFFTQKMKIQLKVKKRLKVQKSKKVKIAKMKQEKKKVKKNLIK